MNESITDRQLEIIKAAGKILTNAGVKGLTTKNLSKEMGFSEAAIYRHFGNKEKIIVTLLEYIAHKMDELYTIELKNVEHPEQKFILIFKNQFKFFTKNPHFAVAVFSDGLLEESQSINKAILKIMAVKVKHLKPVIKKGQDDGIFTSALSTDGLMHVVMGSIRLQMYKWRVDNFQSNLTSKGNHLVNSLLKLLKS